MGMYKRFFKDSTEIQNSRLRSTLKFLWRKNSKTTSETAVIVLDKEIFPANHHLVPGLFIQTS